MFNFICISQVFRKKVGDQNIFGRPGDKFIDDSAQFVVYANFANRGRFTHFIDENVSLPFVIERKSILCFLKSLPSAGAFHPFTAKHSLDLIVHN